MNGNFPIGSRVKIQTKYSGMYNGKIGTVIEDPAKVAFNYDDSWIRVRFDTPAIFGENQISDDIFRDNELTLFKEYEQ